MKHKSTFNEEEENVSQEQTIIKILLINVSHKSEIMWAVRVAAREW